MVSLEMPRGKAVLTLTRSTDPGSEATMPGGASQSNWTTWQQGSYSEGKARANSTCHACMLKQAS